MDFLENIDEQDLRAAVAEIKQVHATGILPDGVVRRLTRGLVDRTRIPTAEARDVVEKARIAHGGLPMGWRLTP